MLDIEHGLISLWPLHRWSRVADEAPHDALNIPADAIVFADHSAWCWAYAAEFERGTQRTIVHIVGGGCGTPIAESFTEFLELILTNSKRLHGHGG